MYLLLYVQITSEARRYLGSAVRSPAFVKSYINEKVRKRTYLGCVNSLMHSHNAAFSALTHGLLGRWIYLFRTLPNINKLLSLLENCTHMQLLLGKCVFSDLERQLLSLPSQLGGVGIVYLCVSWAVQ